MTIVDYAFRPATLTVSVGTNVIWTYATNGTDIHTVTSNNLTQSGTPIFQSTNPNPLHPGQSYNFTFYNPGHYTYYCAVHPSLMKGVINVAPKAQATPAAPCSAPTSSSKCAIFILGPGGALNSNTTVRAPGGSFILSFAVVNFTLVQAGTTNDVNTTTAGPGSHNEGHIHVFVDSVYVTIWSSSNGIPLTLPPGTHTVSLHLVNDFHQEFSPPITATTSLTINDAAADNLQISVGSAQATANSARIAANSALNTVNNAQMYSLGALIVSLITLLALFVAFATRKLPQT